MTTKQYSKQTVQDEYAIYQNSIDENESRIREITIEKQVLIERRNLLQDLAAKIKGQIEVKLLKQVDELNKKIFALSNEITAREVAIKEYQVIMKHLQELY